MADLKTNLLGFTMNSPIIGASGTVGYGVEYEELADFAKDRRHLRQGTYPARPVRQQGRAPVGDPLPASSTASACKTPAFSISLMWS